MAVGGEMLHPLVVHHLERALSRATVWVAMDPPEMAEPARWLDWQRRAGYRLPIAQGRREEGANLLLAWTDQRGARRLPSSQRPAWTLAIPFVEVAQHGIEVGAGAIVLDAGSRATITIDRPGFERLVGAGRDRAADDPAAVEDAPA
jgi:hypothetical protein